jgi:hypothetical protein
MTAPAPAKPPLVVGNRTEPPKSNGFGAPTPPDHRTTALQSAVAVLRGGKPAPQTNDVLDMAEAFYQFLKKGSTSDAPARTPTA